MYWIGLTGGIGTGKSTVSNIIKKRGIPVVDADLISHQVVGLGTPGLALIKNTFGQSVISHDGQLDRKKLADIVFDDHQKLLELESLLHPLVQQEVTRQKNILQQQGHALSIYDVPLLFEKKLAAQFDLSALVYCREDQQQERITSRNPDQLQQNLLKRIRAQIPIEEKKQLAQYIIDNSGPIGDLEKEVDKFLAYLNNYRRA